MIKDFMKEEDGLGTVEIVIIIAVLVGVALIFRDSLIKFVAGIIDNVFNEKEISNSLDSDSIRKDRE
jgi:Flp pilus assembly pilin Flp